MNELVALNTKKSTQTRKQLKSKQTVRENLQKSIKDKQDTYNQCLHKSQTLQNKTQDFFKQLEHQKALKKSSKDLKNTIVAYENHFRTILSCQTKQSQTPELNPSSIAQIIGSYNSLHVQGWLLSEKYLLLSQTHLKNLKEYNNVSDQLRVLNENLVDSNYVSSFPFTFNQHRLQVMETIVYDYKNEDIIIKLYGEIYNLSHRLRIPLKNLKKHSGLTNNLRKALKNLKKLFCKMPNLKFRQSSVKGLKLNIKAKYLEIFPNDIQSAQLMFELINSVMLI